MTVSYEVGDKYHTPETVLQKRACAKITDVLEKTNSWEIHSTIASNLCHKSGQAL